MRNSRFLLFLLAGLLLLGLAVWSARTLPTSEGRPFDGQQAYADVVTQVAFGPRTPGSPAHAQAIAWIRAELEQAGWQVAVQETTVGGHPIRNILASRSDEPPQVILGAHYDSRLLADRDPGPGQIEPVPGANDGASGVAVLLELARSLPEDTVPVWLVFFDAEDNGQIGDWEWIMGSRVFAASLTVRPQAVVIVDMIGDADLNIYYERNSAPDLAAEIWGQAAALGYREQFIPEYRYSILDDHIPFLDLGLPAVDIIDFDYPYWHTTADTPDKVSAESLQVVGETLWHWIVGLRE
ncbi:MAG: M28 family peptidase [Anaerolineales bacterium]|nr:M28 family peptidase [Anaerolineales bacterium]